jgi:hypothetical protein
MGFVNEFFPVRQNFYSMYSRLLPLKLQVHIRQTIQYFHGYRALPNVFKPIKTNLGEIVNRSQTRFLPERNYIGRIMSGDWDRQKEDLHNTTTYKGLHEHFSEGKPWEDTEYYHHAKYNIETNGEFYGYTSSREFLKGRCEYIDELYESIRENGLQSGSGEAPYDENRPWSHYDPTGISVLIGRKGEILLHDGTHRLAIANILGIDEVPVHVLVRHEKWQQVRERVHEDGEKWGEDHINHPDLQHLL